MAGDRIAPGKLLMIIVHELIADKKVSVLVAVFKSCMMRGSSLPSADIFWLIKSCAK